MHSAVRLVGWCLVVAALVGIFWPERPELIEPTAMDYVREPTRAPPPGGAPAPTGCMGEPCPPWSQAHP